MLRKPFFFIALFLIAVIVLVQMGDTRLLDQLMGATGGIQAGLGDLLPADGPLRDIYDKQTDQVEALAGRAGRIPGLAVPYMALVDGLLLYTMLLVTSSVVQVVPPPTQAKVQGCLTLVLSILLILAAIVMIFVAIGKILLMVALLLAFPFGTIVYFIKFASFNRSGANAILSLVMTLKIAFAACLVLANAKFLQNIGLVLLVATSLISTLVVTFLHNLVPRFLVSITDAVGAVVMGIIAIIWAIILIIGAIIAIIMVIKGLVL